MMTSKRRLVRYIIFLFVHAFNGKSLLISSFVVLGL